MRSLALLVVASLLALLLAEGVTSLLADASLSERLAMRVSGARAAPVVAPTPMTDAERFDAVGSGAGIYRVHEDPFVGYVLKSERTLAILDGRFTTDALGLRARPGPAPPGDALRLVVLGDSIAFGYGVGDDETLAAGLERALAQIRGPGLPPIAARTVAVPSWNHRNAFAALVDHWDALQADVVVYLPVVNDLSDANQTYEIGTLRLAPDPAAADPWLMASRSQLGSVEDALIATLASQGVEARGPQLGPRVLSADVSPESSRRYDENVASIVALRRWLADHGARLLVALSGDDEYVWHLGRRLADAEPTLPVHRLQTHMPPELTLGDNPHPSADTLRTWGGWLASRLAAEGLVDAGRGAALPPAPPAWQAVAAPPWHADDVRARSLEARQLALEALQPAFDLTTGQGLRQVFGGLNLDGSVKLRARWLLAAHGGTLEIVVAPLVDRADLYPMRVEVRADDVALGELIVRAGKVTRERLTLPRREPPDAPLEVLLVPERWGLVVREGRSQLASFHPVRLSTEER